MDMLEIRSNYKGLQRAFSQEIKKISTEHLLQDSDLLIQSIFRTVYSDKDYSKEIHEIIFRKDVKCLSVFFIKKMKKHCSRLWKQKVDILIGKTFRNKEFEDFFSLKNENLIQKKRRAYFFSRLVMIQKLHPACLEKIEEYLDKDKVWLKKMENVNILTLSLSFIKCIPNLLETVKIQYQRKEKCNEFGGLGYSEVHRTIFSQNEQLILRSFVIKSDELVNLKVEKNVFYFNLFDKVDELLFESGVSGIRTPKKAIYEAIENYKNENCSHQYNQLLSLVPKILQGFAFPGAFSPAHVWLKEKYPQWNAPLWDKNNFSSKRDEGFGLSFRITSPEKGKIQVLQRHRFIIQDSSGKKWGHFFCDWCLEYSSKWSGTLTIETIECCPELDGLELEMFKKKLVSN